MCGPRILSGILLTIVCAIAGAGIGIFAYGFTRNDCGEHICQAIGAALFASMIYPMVICVGSLISKSKPRLFIYNLWCIGYWLIYMLASILLMSAWSNKCVGQSLFVVGGTMFILMMLSGFTEVVLVISSLD